MAEEQGTLFGICSHRRTAEVELHTGPHHAKQVCSDCGKFLKWIPKPETLKRREENDKILTALSKLKDLPPWERRFVRNLVTHTKISPHQQAKLLELRDLLLGKGGSP